MNSLLETLPNREKELFKQLVLLYDEKKFKKSLKLLNKLQEMSPNFTGALMRV